MMGKEAEIQRQVKMSFRSTLGPIDPAQTDSLAQKLIKFESAAFANTASHDKKLTGCTS